MLVFARELHHGEKRKVALILRCTASEIYSRFFLPAIVWFSEKIDDARA